MRALARKAKMTTVTLAPNVGRALKPKKKKRRITSGEVPKALHKIDKAQGVQ